MAKEMICTNCGHQGKPKLIIKGSAGLEILLWLFFIIPGLIYSLWRSLSPSAKQLICRKCKAPNMIPLDSPLAQKILAPE